MNVWRDDPSNKQTATVNTAVITAEDKVDAKGIYLLAICHVRGFHGRGFMFSVKIENSPCSNGRICYGEDEAAYDLALVTGREELNRLKEKLDREMEGALPSHSPA